MTELNEDSLTTIICDVINGVQLTAQQIKVIDQNNELLITICNEHRAIPLFYNSYNKIHSKDIVFFKKLQQKFYANLACQKIIDLTIFQLLRDFNNKNIKYITLKGFALANSIYTEPYMRPFVDIDILLNVEDIAKAKKVFIQHDFINTRGWQPKYIISQFTMYKQLSKKLFCYFDVHEKISNDPKLAALITYQDAYKTSYIKSVEGLDITMISHINAFIHSCFHLVRHQYQGDLVRIAWLYDLYLLLSILNKTEQESLLVLINQKALNNVVKKALSIALMHFPKEEISKFDNQINTIEGSPFDYLLSAQNGISRFVFKLKATENMTSLWWLIKETIIPPRAEIENKYGRQQTYFLPFFYIKRFIFGVIKWLKK